MIREPAVSHLDVLCLIILIRYIFLKFLHLGVLFICIMCICAHTCATVLVWQPESGFWEPGFSSHRVGPRHWTSDHQACGASTFTRHKIDILKASSLNLGYSEVGGS